MYHPGVWTVLKIRTLVSVRTRNVHCGIEFLAITTMNNAVGAYRQLRAKARNRHIRYLWLALHAQIKPLHSPDSLGLPTLPAYTAITRTRAVAVMPYSMGTSVAGAGYAFYRHDELGECQHQQHPNYAGVRTNYSTVHRIYKHDKEHISFDRFNTPQNFLSLHAIYAFVDSIWYTAFRLPVVMIIMMVSHYLELMSLKSGPWSQFRLNKKGSRWKKTSSKCKRTSAVSTHKGTAVRSCGIPSRLTCNQRMPAAIRVRTKQGKKQKKKKHTRARKKKMKHARKYT